MAQHNGSRFRSPRTGRHRVEALIPKVLLFMALISVFTTIGIVLTLLFETVAFFREVSFLEFVTADKWTALFSAEQREFGIMPLVAGTLLVTVGAAFVAIPIGIGSAIFLSEYAPDGLRKVVKPMLEVLAGIPTIVYGFFALTFVTPLLRQVFPGMGVFNALSASLVVGIMIIPMIASLSEDAMRSVPRGIREAAYALGATKLEVAVRVVLPAALSGVIASFVLGISRAIGETMIVTIAAGATPNLTLDMTDSIQTMTAYMVQAATGDNTYGSTPYLSIYAVGMTLFIFTFIMNMLAQFIARRYKEEY
ncbi:phosphate ABC transporter permease subunit PstC [Mechercharimyces sp. CAU 1602]|uniref:phosphate ABC transporter permease subunit PstC n=1 Tax=Mechercharimyces sp. CAU 1602 TaxID=2973933 RepID=UPI0021627560|nr:phosphate ABC transporter permease subunit PstC [Mechercharimyces sp. CAU 1602]MCS1351600.1 phosphate ABC transporter permease subunit PstC [Mechercharimyces sp. CAU 1602]